MARRGKPSAEDLRVLVAHEDLLEPCDLVEFDDDDLAERQVGMSNLRARVLERGRAMQREYDRRCAARKLAEMPDAERDALVQLVADAGGIESAERVGEG